MKAFASTTDTAAPPLLFTVAIYSTLILIVVLFAIELTYRLRRPVERTNRLVQKLSESEYNTAIQGPAAAVILASVSGYGLNVLTDNHGWHGYVGFLLAMPLPLAMVTWSGIRTVRMSTFEHQWPPVEIPPGDRVKVRGTLRRTLSRGADLTTTDSNAVADVLAVVVTLLETTVPALRKASGRSTTRWLRDNPAVAVIVLAWTLGTVTCWLIAVLPLTGTLSVRRLLILVGFIVVTLATATRLLTVVSTHSRFKDSALADEVEESAGKLRERVREHVFLPGTVARRPGTSPRSGLIVP